MVRPAKLKLDEYLLLSVVILLLWGLVMVASASMPIASRYGLSSLHYFIRQSLFAGVSVIAVLVMLRLPMQFWQRLGGLWLLGALLLLVLVLTPGIGHEVNGSRRWIRLGPIALQVSEAVKLCVVLYIAGYLERHRVAVNQTLVAVIRPLLVLALIAVMLLAQPDFGASVVVFVTTLGMMFMAGVRARWFVLLLVLAALAAVALVLVSPYRLARLVGFLHPWQNQATSGYQLTQALIAFGRGGWAGVGLGDSLQKMFYLPEAHTDFILAITGEELGVIGILGILALYGVVVSRGLQIGRLAQKRQALYNAYASFGVTFWLGFQVVVNFGVNLGLLPTKGLTLPFMSYGGSSLLINCAAIAILLRCDLENKLAANNHDQQYHDLHGAKAVLSW